MYVKKIIGIVCVTLLSIGFVRQESEIKIGLAITLSGRGAQDGQHAQRGAEMAIEEINKNGGVNGNKIILVVKDDKGTEKDAIKVAEDLATQEDIFAVVGHIYSKTTLAAAPVYNNSKIVQLTPTSTSPAITYIGSWTFRICTNDRFQIRDIARYAAKVLNKSRIAIFYEDDVYGERLRGEFSKIIGIYKKSIVYETKYSQAKKNYADKVSLMNDKQPDLLFIAGYADQGLEIIKEIRKSGGEYDILGADGLYTHDFIERGGKDVEEVMMARLFNHLSNNNKTQIFIQNFKKKYNTSLDDNAAYTYDAIKLIAEALKHDLSRHGVQDYLNQIGKKYPVYEGVTGKVLFNENGDSLKPVTIMVVKDGELIIP